MFRARQYGTQQDERHAGACSCLSLSAAFGPQAATDLPPAACTGMLGANKPENRCLQSCLADKALALVKKQTNKHKINKFCFCFVQYLQADGGQAM